MTTENKKLNSTSILHASNLKKKNLKNANKEN